MQVWLDGHKDCAYFSRTSSWREDEEWPRQKKCSWSGKESCYTKIVGFFALQLQWISLNMNFREKDATATVQHKLKKKKKGVLYDTADYIFPWDISVTSAESVLFFLHSFGIWLMVSKALSSWILLKMLYLSIHINR